MEQAQKRTNTDIHPRNTSGDILEHQHFLDLYKVHMALTGEGYLNQAWLPTSEDIKFPEVVSYSVSLDFKACIAAISQPGDISQLYFSIYSKVDCRPISEPYCLNLTPLGMPLENDKIGITRTLFVDIHPKELDGLLLVCKIIRKGRMNRGDDEAESKFRRPFGVAILDLTNCGPTEQEHEMKIYCPSSEANFPTLIDNLAQKNYSGMDVSSRNEIIVVSVGVYTQKPSETCTLTPRITFPDTFTPSDLRNNLFVTLISGDFQTGRRATAKNVEVSVTVRSRSGDVCAAFPSTQSGTPTTSFESTVYYHTNSPKWLETLKVTLSPQDYEQMHLFFTIRHVSSTEKGGDPQDKNIAFAFLPLLRSDKSVSPDGIQNLNVYKWDKKCAADPMNYLYLHERSIGQEKSLSNFMSTGTLRKTTFTGSSVLQAMSASALTLSIDKDLPPDSPTNVANPATLIKDSFQIRLQLMSSYLTQSSSISTLLKLPTLRSVLPLEEMRNILKEFTFVGEHEIVKFLPGILSTLFMLLELPTGTASHREIMRSLTFVLNIAQSSRFALARSTLLTYIEEKFSFEKVHNTLLKGMRMTFDYPSKEGGKDVRAIVKCWEWLSRFIVRSQQLDTDNDSPGWTEFFPSVKKLMSAAAPDSLIGSQTLALTHWPSLIRILQTEKVYTAVELARITREVLDACLQKKKVIECKAHLLMDLVRGPIFEDAAAREELMLGTADCLKQALNIGSESLARTMITALMQMIDALHSTKGGQSLLVQLSIHVLPALLLYSAQNSIEALNRDDRLTVAESVSRLSIDSSSESQLAIPALAQLSSKSKLSGRFQDVPERGLSKLSMSSVGSESEKDKREDRDKSRIIQQRRGQVCELAAVIFSLLGALGEQEMQTIFLDRSNGDTGSALQLNLNTSRNLISFFSNLVCDEVFPRQWVALVRMTYSRLFKICQNFALLLSSYGQMDENINSEFLTLLSQLILSSTYEDLGLEEALDLFNKMWAHLNEGCKRAMTLTVLRPILEMVIQVDKSVRDAAIQCYWEMLHLQWRDDSDKSLTTFETATIQNLDRILTEYFQKLAISTPRSILGNANLCDELRSRIPRNTCIPTDQIDLYLSRLDQYLQLTLTLQQLPLDDPEFSDDWTTASLKLLRFIKVIDPETLYPKYIHQLADLQFKNNNFVESGITLKLHADCFSWNLDNIIGSQEPFFTITQTEFERKEVLFQMVIRCLEKGNAWEQAIIMCKEVYQAHERLTYCYHPQISLVLAKMSDFYMKIVTVPRYPPQYFRVGFYGGGFPKSLRNMQYIYRGLELEHIAVFTEKLQEKHPAARILGNEEVSQAIKDGDGQYIQIAKVNPEPSTQIEKYLDARRNNAAVPKPVIDYYEHNEVNMFTFQRPFRKKTIATNGPKRPEQEFLDLWIECTIMATDETFPTSSRRLEISKITKVEKSPIQNAVEAMHAKNEELHFLCQKYRASSENVNPLTMSIKGAVDAAVNGGVPMYRAAFFGPEYKEWLEASVVCFSDDANACRTKEFGFIDQLSEMIDQQVCDENSSSYCYYVRAYSVFD